jgi:hypothetical protein
MLTGMVIVIAVAIGVSSLAGNAMRQRSAESRQMFESESESEKTSGSSILRMVNRTASHRR